MSKQRSVYVIGAGGHGKVVVRSLQNVGHEVSALFDDNSDLCGTSILGIPVLGPIAEIVSAEPKPTVIAIGDNRARSQIAARYELEYLTVVDPRAIVDPSVTIGAGTVILAGAVVVVDAELGEHVIVNHGATVDHDCTVGSFAHLCPGVHLAGGVTLGKGAMMGIGAVAIPGARIGSWSVIGAGGVVVESVPADVVAVGAPARVLRSPNLPNGALAEARGKQPTVPDCEPTSSP